MDRAESQGSTSLYLARLLAENQMLREEIRVSREAADITVKLVVEQFEKTEAMMHRLELAGEDLNQKNAELEGANERLQQLDKLKSDFLSSVSHELRTPLTSIRGFAALIEREFGRSFAVAAADDPALKKKAGRIQENLAIILKESERLTRLINDVLDLAKIESGRTEWRDATLQVDGFVRDAANAAQGMFAAKPAVTLTLDIAEHLPPFVGDADRMQQVLVNLLNNAVKFTEQGSVGVKAWLTEDQRIRIDVTDTGLGFPPEEAESIFDKFQQAKQGDTLVDRPKGTGLGLAICREIVNRHGGRIWASSQPGVGSVFSIELPPADGEAAAAEDSARASDGAAKGNHRQPGSGRRVLVVDDDTAIRSYFSQLLQEQGYAVSTAADGEAALAAVRRQRPDLITMDLSMPIMDGRTAIRHLRADPVLKDIPIMVISAIPGWESAGGDLAMPKPLDEHRFVENIRILLHDEPADQRTLEFLVLYEEGRAQAVIPESFSAKCKVDFCSTGQLSDRVRAGFQGMVAIPVDLLGKVDIDLLHASPALRVMIMPVSDSGENVIPLPVTTGGPLNEGNQP
jgi:signal transduction histidine kinase